MKNEEKAREIANDNCTHICMEDCSAESYFSSEIDCLKSALAAMEWKDKQLKKVCAGCNQHIQKQGKRCPWRSIDNTYCWED